MSRETSAKIASIAGQILSPTFKMSELDREDLESLAASALSQREPDDGSGNIPEDPAALGQFIFDNMWLASGGRTQVVDLGQKVIDYLRGSK